MNLWPLEMEDMQFISPSMFVKTMMSSENRWEGLGAACIG
jgi:hypothetical protein